MKKITFLFFLLAASLSYSQVVLEDFEGTPPALNLNNGMGSATIVADPEMGGTRGQVLELITSDAGESWQQAELFLQGDSMDLTTDKTVSIDVYSDAPFVMLAKVGNGTSGPDSATSQAHPGGGVWLTLDFDFNAPEDGTAAATGTYPEIYFLPMWNGMGTGSNTVNNNWENPANTTTYVDNITAVAAPAPETCSDGILNNGETEVDCGGPNCDPCPSPPTVGAPTPPNREDADVISIYSDTYDGFAGVPVDTFDAGWCGAPSVEEVMIDGNPTLRYLGLPCQGIDFQNNRIDATGFTNFHFDFYTDEADILGKVFNFKLVDFAGGGSEASAFEININDGTTPGVVTGTWVSVDVSIPGSFAVNDIAQIGITSNLSSVWYDNIYFHKNTLGTDEFTRVNFKVYPNPTANNWNIESNTTISSITIYDILGKKVSTLTPNASEVEINSSAMNTGLYFAKIVSENGSKTVKLIKE